MRFRAPFVLHLHLRLFQLLGFFNLSLDVQPQRRLLRERLLLLWTLLLLLLFSAMAIFVFVSDEEFFFAGDHFGYFNDVFKVSIAQMAIVTIYVESLLRVGPLRAFWILYANLHKQDEHGKAAAAFSWPQLREHARFLVIFYGFVVFEVVVWLQSALLFSEMDRHMCLFLVTFTPYVYVTHLRCMQFLMHLEVMRLELVALAQDLNLLADYTRFVKRVGTFHGFEEFLRSELRQKQLVYQHIYEMFQNFQAAFGCSMIAVLLMIYVRVLVDSYFLYYITYRDLYQGANVFLLPAIFQIPAFLMTSKNCMSVVKHITYQLHNIISPTHSGLLSVQIQNFSLQILHAKIRIDGVGIGTMDGYMLSRAVGAITTYMVFFIQFMPKFQNLSH